MSKPAFWLKITPTYVIENFDELQNYVNAYDYDYPEGSDSDFNRTVDYLSEVARGIIAVAAECSLDETPGWGMDADKALRIVATAIVAERKRGIVGYDMIIGLMRMLLFTYKVPSEYKRSFLKNINACARKATLRSMSISMPELMPERFSQARLCSGVAALAWNTANAPSAYYEGKGTVVFSDEGVEIAPMNHDGIIETSRKRRTVLDVSPKVRLTDAGGRRISRQTLLEMIDSVPLMLHEFENVRPSRERKIKQYAAGDYMDVRVRKIFLPRIECETIDPEYHKVVGKIMIDTYNLGVPREFLQARLKVGDVLPAVYNPGEDCVFGISRDAEEEKSFKEYVCENHPKSMMSAVRTESYGGGTRWLSETGILVNVPTWKENNINLPEHMGEGSCVKVRICEITFDRKGNVVANGEFADEEEQTLPDVDYETFVRQANGRLAQSLITFMESNPVVEIHEGTPEIRTSGEIADTLGLLMMRNAEEDRDLSSAERVGYIVAAEALFICTQSETDMLTARRELSYRRAVTAFAMGESPVSLSLNVDERIASHQRSFDEMNIIETLRQYKETHHAIRVSDSLIGEQPDMIGDLVKASNTLIDKIGVAELSRIKRSIAVKLGAGDAYRETYHNHTYYGEESDTLEFKISCVRPPANRQTGSFEGDLRMQHYTIFKTVCAFLNSPSGGDLLVGVNDEGYGTGIRGDIDLLHGNHLIPEANADRLRVYIKNRIDQAFVSNDGTVTGNAITVGNVLVNIETTKEGTQILRVKVNPYPYDVVRIRKDLCPQGYKDVFFRSSGASEPLDSNGVRNVRMQKLQAIDPNDSKIATVLEAIDNKQQLRIGRYISHQESTNRIIEPHRLMMGNTALQAYDRSTNQMRLFKLSRIEGLELLGKHWEAERKHRSWPVDVFGMMQSEKNKGALRRIKMSKYAKILLQEEYPLSLDDTAVTWSENTDADRTRFPVMMETMIYNESGMQRFLLGLPEEALLVED